MITLDLPSDLENRLKEASRTSGESFASIAETAFREWLQDFEDVMEAERRLKAGEGDPDARISFEEMKRRLGLAN